jgi:hypothetical protein
MAQEPADPSQDCSSLIRSYALGRASSEELAFVKEVLDNIQPGTATQDEVAKLLGEPGEITGGETTAEGWHYNYATSAPRGSESWSISVHYGQDDRQKVAMHLGLGNAMSLGQLVELFGDPSSVYRIYSRDVGAPWTLLFYEDYSMAAVIWEALCPGNYPADVTVTRISTHPPETRWEKITHITSEDIEMEWTGITQ